MRDKLAIKALYTKVENDLNMKESKLAYELQQDESGYKNIRSMLAHLDDMESIFILLGRNQKIAYINIAGCNALETEYDLAVGKNWFDNFILEPDRQHIKIVFDKLMDGKLEQFNTHTNAVLTTKGNENTIRWDNSLIKNKTKDIVGSFSLGKEQITPNDMNTITSICAYCKNIRNSNDQWEILEKYFSEKDGLEFSHGICPDCYREELEKIGN